jgi:hypothetical protein
MISIHGDFEVTKMWCDLRVPESSRSTPSAASMMPVACSRLNCSVDPQREQPVRSTADEDL